MDSSGDKWVEYDQNSQVAQMCSIAAKPPKRTNALPDSSEPQQKKPRRVKPEPLEEDSFLLRVENSDDELHSKVVETCRGMGYDMTRTRGGILQ